MEQNINGTAARIKARDAAMRMVNRLTAGVAFAAMGGVAVFGVVSAHTVPGASSAISTASSSTTSASGSSSSSGLTASTTSATSSSKSGVAVSGGS